MTAAEHITEAERLLSQADRWESNVTDDLDSYSAIDGSRQAAQVHATLAVAAATLEANRLRRGPLHNQGFA